MLQIKWKYAFASEAVKWRARGPIPNPRLGLILARSHTALHHITTEQREEFGSVPHQRVAIWIRGRLHACCLDGTHHDTTLAKIRCEDSWPCDIANIGSSLEISDNPTRSLTSHIQSSCVRYRPKHREPWSSELVGVAWLG
jgi:hypothetical protein